MPEIILHQWEASPFCGKVRRILRHKGLAYSTVEYPGLKMAQAGRLSPVGKLPVLEYEGEKIQDSSVIARFLEARHPEPSLFPTDPLQRHLVHIFEDWADESLYWHEIYLRFMYDEAANKFMATIQQGRPAIETRLLTRVVVPLMRRKLKEQGLGRYPREYVVQQFMHHVEHLDGILQQQPWLVGESYTLADISVVSQLLEVRRTSHLADALRRYPALTAWMDKLD